MWGWEWEGLPMDFFEFRSGVTLGVTLKFMLLCVEIATIAIRVQQISSIGAIFAFQEQCVVNAFYI